MRARHATVHATIAIDTHGHNNTADAVQQGELAAFSQLQLCSSTARHVASVAAVPERSDQNDNHARLEWSHADPRVSPHSSQRAACGEQIGCCELLPDVA